MPAVSTYQRPLGLKTTVEVSQKVLETLRFIEGFDLEVTATEGSTLEFKRFLALPVVYPDPQEFSFVPSLRVDALWHAFILNTPHYRKFCDSAYGGYLDHVPGKSRRETDRAIQRGSMQFTVEKMSETFDNVNKHFWKRLTFCGPCLIFAR